MHCEEAKNKMMDRASRSFEPCDDPAFEEHLAGCNACRDAYQGMIHVERMAMEWEDEPVPEWDRLSHVMPQKNRPSLWFTLVPLAACVLLSMLVFSRATITHDASGWRLAFGGSGVDEAAVARAVNDALLKERAHNAREMQRMLAEVNDANQKNMEVLTANVTNAVRDQRQDDIKRLISGWRDQRDKDMGWVEGRFQTLSKQQERTQSNLYRVVSYVSEEN